jgi:hypothetical protein
MTYDPKCYELAESFLKDEGIDTPRTISQLAAQIQLTIEEYIEGEQEQREVNE